MNPVWTSNQTLQRISFSLQHLKRGGELKYLNSYFQWKVLQTKPISTLKKSRMGCNKWNTDNSQQQIQSLEQRLSLPSGILHSCGLRRIISTQLKSINTDHWWCLPGAPLRHYELVEAKKKRYFSLCPIQYTLKMKLEARGSSNQNTWQSSKPPHSL